MATGLLTTGELFIQQSSFKINDITRPPSVDILLYNDSTDSIIDGDNLTDVSTEPGGTSYSRQSVNLDGNAVTIQENVNGNVEFVFDNVTFDVSDSTNTVDSYGIVANFDATLLSEGVNGDNLIATGALDTSQDLSNNNSSLIVESITGVIN